MNEPARLAALGAGYELVPLLRPGSVEDVLNLPLADNPRVGVIAEDVGPGAQGLLDVGLQTCVGRNLHPMSKLLRHSLQRLLQRNGGLAEVELEERGGSAHAEGRGDHDHDGDDKRAAGKRLAPCLGPYVGRGRRGELTHDLASGGSVGLVSGAAPCSPRPFAAFCRGGPPGGWGRYRFLERRTMV